MHDAKQVIEGYGTPTEVPYEFTKYTTEEMIDIIKAAGNTFNIPMTERLAKLFGNLTAPPKQEEPVQKAPEPVVEQAPIEQKKEYKWVDNRSFSEKYTLKNIAREIKIKLVGA